MDIMRSGKFAIVAGFQQACRSFTMRQGLYKTPSSMTVTSTGSIVLSNKRIQTGERMPQNPKATAAADETTGPLRPGCLEHFKTNNIYSSQILRAKTLVEKLAMLPLAAQPTKVDPAPSKLSRPFTGSPWRRPVFSRRQLAVLKKEATAAGLEWPMPEKEVPPGQSFYERKVFTCKGHKYERDAPKRQASIAEKMAEMPQKIQEHQAALKKKRFKTELQKLLAVPKKRGY